MDDRLLRDYAPRLADTVIVHDPRLRSICNPEVRAISSGPVVTEKFWPPSKVSTNVVAALME
jgi:hypothetical protein